MLYAIDEHDNLIRATKSADGWCPACHNELVARCGDVNADHWAHKSKCPYIWNTESPWHLLWKELAELNGCKLEQIHINRIADSEKNNNIFEFQHSNIEVSELIDRSEFYSKRGYLVNWVFDVSDKYDKEHFRFKYKFNNIYYLNTKWVSKSLSPLFVKFQSNGITRSRLKYGDVYLDIGRGKPIFKLFSLHENGNGSGSFVQRNGMFQPFYFTFDNAELNDDYELFEHKLYSAIY